VILNLLCGYHPPITCQETDWFHHRYTLCYVAAWCVYFRLATYWNSGC